MGEEIRSEPWVSWVHCNVCWTREDSKIQFTSCGHFVCRDCAEGFATCRVCLTPCSTISIHKATKSSVKDYFSDPVHFLQKNLDIVRFQVTHMVSLLSHHKDQTRLLQEAQESGLQATELLREYQRERGTLLEGSRRQQEQIAALSIENKKLKEELKRLQTQSRPAQRAPIIPASQTPSNNVASQQPLISQTAKSYNQQSPAQKWSPSQNGETDSRRLGCVNLDLQFSESSHHGPPGASRNSPSSTGSSRDGSVATRVDSSRHCGRLEEIYPSNSVRSPVVIRNSSLLPLQRPNRQLPGLSSQVDSRFETESLSQRQDRLPTPSSLSDSEQITKRRRERYGGGLFP